MEKNLELESEQNYCPFQSQFRRNLLKVHAYYIRICGVIFYPLIQFEDWFAGNTDFFIENNPPSLKIV